MPVRKPEPGYDVKSILLLISPATGIQRHTACDTGSSIWSWLATTVHRYPPRNCLTSFQSHLSCHYILCQSIPDYALNENAFFFSQTPFLSVIMKQADFICRACTKVTSFFPSTLSSCSHAVVALLYPFSWQHTFIPVLPSSMIDIVCCPTPFLVGLLSSSLPKLKELPVEEVRLEPLMCPKSTCQYWIWLDSHQISVPKSLLVRNGQECWCYLTVENIFPVCCHHRIDIILRCWFWWKRREMRLEVKISSWAARLSLDWLGLNGNEIS